MYDFSNDKKHLYYNFGDKFKADRAAHSQNFIFRPYHIVPWGMVGDKALAMIIEN